LGFFEDFASPIFGVHLKVTHEKKPPRNCSKISISLLRIKRLKNANVNRFKIAKSVSKSLKIYFRKKITQEYFNMSFCNLMRSFEKKTVFNQRNGEKDDNVDRRNSMGTNPSDQRKLIDFSPSSAVKLQTDATIPYVMFSKKNFSVTERKMSRSV
jgi:hypothetical protein